MSLAGTFVELHCSAPGYLNINRLVISWYVCSAQVTYLFLFVDERSGSTDPLRAAESVGAVLDARAIPNDCHGTSNYRIQPYRNVQKVPRRF